MNKQDVVQGTLISSVPVPAGYIVLADSAKIVVYKKPNVFHRWMMYVLLGWTFQEYTPIRQVLHG